jgi:hypothetical protein
LRKAGFTSLAEKTADRKPNCRPTMTDVPERKQVFPAMNGEKNSFVPGLIAMKKTGYAMQDARIMAWPISNALRPTRRRQRATSAFRRSESWTGLSDRGPKRPGRAR